MTRLISDDALAVATLWQEARGEPQEGRIGVAEVIRNRMKRHYLSDGTVAGTVLHAFQFSGWNPTDPNRVPSVQVDETDPVVQDCLTAWREALAGSALVGEAVQYLNVLLVLGSRGTLPSWAADPANPKQVNAARVTAVIGHHTFLKGG